MSTMKFRDTAIYYEAHGQGPALVFAHGLGGNCLSWWQQVPHFAGSFTCVILDQPGFGRSGEASGEDWDSADVLGALLDHLGLDRVTLVAQSMGGRTCLGYTLRHPERVRGLVMASTVGVIQLPPEHADYRRLGQATRAALEARGIIASFGERGAREQPALHYLYGAIGRLTAPPRTEAPAGVARVPQAGPEQLATLRCPVLFLIAEEDAVLPPAAAEAGARLVPGARVERVPACGHSIYFERPAIFNRLLERFLAELPA